MIDQSAKKFGVYLVTSIIGDLDDATQRKILTRLQGAVGLDAAVMNDLSANAWQSRIAPKVVDYYAENFDPNAAFKATG